MRRNGYESHAAPLSAWGAHAPDAELVTKYTLRVASGVFWTS